MHQARTAELLTSSLDSKTESFFLNCTLVLRQQPDAMRSFRERVDAWVAKALKVYHGAPPPAVREWRQTMRPLLFSGNTTHVSEAARQHCWDHVLNGDGRVRDEVQHFCEGQACCPKGILDTLTKVLGPHGIFVIHIPTALLARSVRGGVACVTHRVHARHVEPKLQDRGGSSPTTSREGHAKVGRRAQAPHGPCCVAG